MDSISIYEKREALQRLLHSKHFSKTKKLSRFLEFVCEQSFIGDAEKLNEYLIGVEIYERGSDFDPQQDSIVRVQAHEIRKRLKEYFQEEGKGDPLRVDFPPGHYVPIFSRSDAQPAVSEPLAAIAETEPLAVKEQPNRNNKLVLILSLLCLLLAALLIREKYFVQNFAPQLPQYLPETMTWFWGPFLPPADPPLIVIPNHPMLRLRHEGDSLASLAQSTLIPKEKLPEFRDTIHFRELPEFRFVTSLTDFTAVGETLGLLNFIDLFSRVGMKVRLKESRLTDYEMVKRGNTVLLGGNQAWSGRIFIYPEGFWFRAGVITNQTPLPGEIPVYKPEFDPITSSLRTDYALVLMLPNEKAHQRILLIYGIYTQGSLAAIEYVTNEDRLSELQKALVELSPDKKTTPRYFQALLQTTVENYVPGKTTLVGLRIIPSR